MKKSNSKTFSESQAPSDALSKSNVRIRLKRTKLREKDNAYHIETWVAGDQKLMIKWKTHPTILGEIVIASTAKGVCFLGFGEEKRDMALSELKDKFPDNILEEGDSDFQQEAVNRINLPEGNSHVHLHLKGTAFQLSVWGKILKVPFGGLITYGGLGERKGDARAVGSAVGANPVCLIVGCHRVVRSDGNIEGFHYGTAIKERLLAFEAAHSQLE
jgi:AraC family transcriptional regulator of adaptative response/methylated-DNA-[protein]-cysteine methyltransferase